MSGAKMFLAIAGTAVVCGGGSLIVAAIGAAGYMAAKNPVPANLAAAASVPCGAKTITTVSAKTPAGYTATQTANVAVIVKTGQSMGVPPRGWVIAVATAMQEDNLNNSGKATDHDSLGLFQQRPSQGWGTPAQVMNPVYSSTQFYNHLIKVPGWQNLPLTVAAQAVQHSAFPGAYAKHEKSASMLVDAVTGGASNAVVVSGTCAAPGQVTAGGWTQPVVASIGSPFGPRGKEFHAGVDLMASRRTAIKAASDGTVIEAHCDASTSATWSCDRDGQLDAHGNGITPGCGWMVEIKHANHVITVYCHMVVQPLVVAGQHVAAGQQIGWSGTSGHSSGPHVHFEVHVNADQVAKTNAVDPVPFMAQHGAPLGTGRTA